MYMFQFVHLSQWSSTFLLNPSTGTLLENGPPPMISALAKRIF